MAAAILICTGLGLLYYFSSGFESQKTAHVPGLSKPVPAIAQAPEASASGTGASNTVVTQSGTDSKTLPAISPTPEANVSGKEPNNPDGVQPTAQQQETEAQEPHEVNSADKSQHNSGLLDMSYILDALKESEKARGSRKTRALLAEPAEVILIPPSQPRKSLPRWPYIVVLILLLNAGIFVFWLRPWQWGGTNVSSSGISGGQFSETSRQEAPVIPPAPVTQMEVKQEATEMKPDEKQNPAPTTQMEVKQKATESQRGRSKTRRPILQPPTW